MGYAFAAFMVGISVFMVFPFICIAAIDKHEARVRREHIVEQTGFIKLLTTLHLYSLFSAEQL